MSHTERPRVRPGLQADAERPGWYLLHDRLRISSQVLRLSHVELEIAVRMDGRHAVTDLQRTMHQLLQGADSAEHLVQQLVRRMDEALFLDGPRFDEYLGGPDREPSCIGCYPAEPEKLRRMLNGLFTMPGGPGLPASPAANGRLKAALLPHIDYARGNVSYAWGFKELVEQCPASLFVIIATSHYSPARFTLTRKNFKTPLGTVPTDQRYVDRLVHHYGEGLFDDPFAHYPEHSVELEVVFLQHLYANVRPIRIVPLVVGSFRDCVESGTEPREMPDIARMITALRQVEAETDEPICYVISGDLAHIGPKFDDPDPVSDADLSHCESQDHQLMHHAASVDPSAYFRVIAAEQDARRICGLPPTYTLLEAIRPESGRLLHYGRYVHPQGFESVSFASVGFYQ